MTYKNTWRRLGDISPYQYPLNGFLISAFQQSRAQQKQTYVFKLLANKYYVCIALADCYSLYEIERNATDHFKAKYPRLLVVKSAFDSSQSQIVGHLDYE